MHESMNKGSGGGEEGRKEGVLISAKVLLVLILITEPPRESKK